MANLYADQDVGLQLVERVRALGHDVVMTREIGMTRASDASQLLMAAQQGRILVTRNRDDFVLLHDAWVRWPRAWGTQPPPLHAGILVVVHGVPNTLAASDLDRFLRSKPPLVNELYFWTSPGVWELQVRAP